MTAAGGPLASTTMNTVLLTAGVVALMAAVIGGGLSAFNIEIPVLNSRPIRLGLGALGLGFIAAAFLLPPNDDGGVDVAEARYQRRVVATCDSVREVLARESVGPPRAERGELLFDRDIAFARGKANVDAIERRLDLLLAKPVPESLQNQADVLRTRASRFVRRSRAILNELRAALPASFNIQELEAASAPFQGRADAVVARLEDALADLGGRSCSLSSS
jgi:hypothetical protein